MTVKPPVDRLFDDQQRLIELLDANNDVSLRISMDTTLRKVLVLSAASYFEQRVRSSIMDFVKTTSKGSPCLMSLVERKAVERRYHTYFEWGGNNANSFFAVFGTGFKRRMRQRVQEDPELDEGVKAFLRIGLERNALVHKDFATYPFNMTADEVMVLYRRALRFVEAIPRLLKECGGADGV